MKKVFAIILTLCLISSTLCITSFAEEDKPVVMSLYGLKKDGKTVVGLNHWTTFADGWECAVDFAEDDEFMEEQDLDRIIVDLRADWVANSDGEFGSSSWDGFQYSTIYVPSDTRVTINLNGHKIDRGLGDRNEYDGEVICVNDNADLIINGGKQGDPYVKPSENPDNVLMGFISGGNSDNGAGGIQIQDGARVTLNNVNITKNAVDDEDGAGIAAYDGAILTMNGGSISKNTLWCSFKTVAWSYGGLYLNDSTAYLNNVEFEGNIFKGYERAYGVAIYADNSEVIAENCTFKGNGYRDPGNDIWTPISIINVAGGSMELTNCLFEENGTQGYATGPDTIKIDGAIVRINKSIFRNNASESVINCLVGTVEVTETVFEGNISNVFKGTTNEGSFFKKCTFSNNTESTNYKTFSFGEGNKLNFEDCDFGNSTFNDRSRATFNGVKGAGSIFGEGSLTMIIAILAVIALIVSGIAIFMVADMKKKLVPVAANSVAETEDEE